MLEIHYKQTNQPKPNHPLTPSVHGVVLDNNKAILIHKREDHSLWALPGGKLEFGESLVDCLKREIKEETGLEIFPKKLLGVFSSPQYLLSIKEIVVQPLLIVFLCRTTGGKLTINPESSSFAWINQNNIEQYDAFPLVKEIIRFVWSNKNHAFFDEISLK